VNVVYIHGASATGDSFNYIRDQLNYPNETIIEYNSQNGFDQNLSDMKSVIANLTDVVFVCHSLGGIYALHLADSFPRQILGAVTLSTPYGGAESADYAKYFLPFSKLLRDIGPRSGPMKTASQINIQHPWLNVVTTRGDSPWIMQPNDGVVTVSSMRHRKEMQFTELYINHYEVVMSPKTIEIINRFVKKLIDQ
jgi:pimeloyl-ACP methyl ester carboxylesterase